MAKSTAVFIDGFNLYHGICDTRRNDLKWLSLSRLAKRLVSHKTHEISAIYYFSAIAEHLPDRAIRHRIYLNALLADGVTLIMGEFKDKEKPFRCCYGCRHVEIGKEEKQTDVNIALHLVSKAYRGEFQAAILVTADSDLTPVIRLFKSEFPQIDFLLATPPFRGRAFSS